MLSQQYRQTVHRTVSRKWCQIRPKWFPSLQSLSILSLVNLNKCDLFGHRNQNSSKWSFAQLSANLKEQRIAQFFRFSLYWVWLSLTEFDSTEKSDVLSQQYRQTVHRTVSRKWCQIRPKWFPSLQSLPSPIIRLGREVWHDSVCFEQPHKVSSRQPEKKPSVRRGDVYARRRVCVIPRMSRFPSKPLCNSSLDRLVPLALDESRWKKGGRSLANGNVSSKLARERRLDAPLVLSGSFQYLTVTVVARLFIRLGKEKRTHAGFFTGAGRPARVPDNESPMLRR